MKLDYTSYQLASAAINEDTNEIKQIMSAGALTLICSLIFDTDEISDTYNHWICSLEVVSDTEDIPERSFVLYPNTLHFDGDELYTVAVLSDLQEIGHDDLMNVQLIIGVPSDE
jgi:hypothetical protein